MFSKELLRDFSTCINRRTIPTFKSIDDFCGDGKSLTFFPSAEFARTVGDDPVVPEEVPGGHVRDDDVGGVEREVAVHVGWLDVVALGTAKHSVHGGFDVECLIISNPTLSQGGGGLREGHQVRCAILGGGCILLFDRLRRRR